MSQTLEVELQQVVLGSRLSFPICDPQGILLLSAGHEFTADHRDKILARGISQVRINEADLDKIIGANGAARSNGALTQLEQTLNNRIDSLIRSGAFNVTNLEAPLKQSLQRHGAREYSEYHKHRVQSQHTEAAKAVDHVLESVAEGGKAQASEVEAAANGFIRSLVADIGCCLSVVAGKRHLPSITEHSINVAVLAMAIGLEMGLDADNVRLLGISGLLEDIGMALVPENVRNSPRQLTPVEFVEIQRHPLHTANLLAGVAGLPTQVPIITYQTHECPDGSGYPRGRVGTAIHPFARIVHVADVYTALTTERPFRRALKPYSAVECLIRMAHQGKVDRDVVKHLLFVQSLFPIGSYVRLSDGSVAKVIRANGEDYTRPVVSRNLEHSDQHFSSKGGEAVIDLSRSNLTIAEAIQAPGAIEQDLTPEVLGWSNRNVSNLAEELVG